VMRPPGSWPCPQRPDARFGKARACAAVVQVPDSKPLSGAETVAPLPPAWHAIASVITRPLSLPLSSNARPFAATVRTTSALLTGAVSTKPDLKSGPASAHQVPGVGAAQIAGHALALLKAGIGEFGRASAQARRKCCRSCGNSPRYGPRRNCGTVEVDIGERQRARKLPSPPSTERAAHIVLGEQRFDDPAGQLLVPIRNIDQVRPAVGRHHHPRVAADHGVSEPRMGAFANRREIALVVDQRQAERSGEIDSEKAERLPANGRVVAEQLGDPRRPV
jgi:hypothetical protein